MVHRFVCVCHGEGHGEVHQEISYAIEGDEKPTSIEHMYQLSAVYSRLIYLQTFQTHHTVFDAVFVEVFDTDTRHDSAL
jgi:hypothetical protein